MPVELTIVESVTELDTTVIEVVLESASAPGPAGPGVAAGGTVGQVLTKQSGTDFDTDWEDPTGGGGGAPTTVDYLVGTADGTLSNEIVVGTSPGGELGGTWASPTVDTTHSGSSHASVQAAAEATAASELATHSADTTGVHGITDTSALALTANVQPLDSDLTAIAALTTTSFGRGLLELANQAALLSAAGAAAASHTHAQADITNLVTDLAAKQPLDSDLTAIAALTTTSFGRAFLAFADEAAFKAGVNLEAGTDFPSLTTFNDHSARHENGGADEISIAGLDGTPTELTNHLNDTTDAHDASAISVLDTNGDYTATDVEGVLAEIAPQLGGGGGLYDAHAMYQNQQTSGTDGGTLTSGDWRTMPLNTEVFDTDSVGSLSSNQITLPAGSYFLEATCPTFLGGNSNTGIQMRLRNVTDGTTFGIGMSRRLSAANTVTDEAQFVTAEGRLVIAGSKVIEVQMQSGITGTGSGFGRAAGFGTEVYGQLHIYREA